ncbi:hypothetical protein LQL77_31110 [Rhodococcus cerastii]|nr:hypothetical protein [Rhodococcus cerastii]
MRDRCPHWEFTSALHLAAVGPSTSGSARAEVIKVFGIDDVALGDDIGTAQS